MTMDLKQEEITGKIIGCAMAVHRKMKAGYSELIRSRCLAIEFDKIHLAYNKEMELPIYYDEMIVGKRRVDFFVEDKIVVALKAISERKDKELNQSINYLENHRKEIGLLINLGAKSLINSKGNLAINNPTDPSKNPVNPRL